MTWQTKMTTEEKAAEERAAAVLNALTDDRPCDECGGHMTTAFENCWKRCLSCYRGRPAAWTVEAGWPSDELEDIP